MVYGISVIVPVFNAENTIEKCIFSILNQTQPADAIIIVDDGSTDGTKKILDGFKRNSDIQILTQTNQGPSAARNRALKEVKTPYVTFVDSDDFIEKNHLEELRQSMNANSCVDMSVTNYVRQNLNGEYEYKGNVKSDFLNQEQALKNIFIYKGFSGFSCNKLFKTAIIKKNQILFSSKTFLAEDLLFCVEYILHIRLLKVSDSVTYHYVDQEKGELTSYLKVTPFFNPVSLGIITVYKKLLEEIPAIFQKPRKFLKAQMVWRCNNIIRTIYLSNEKYSKNDLIFELKSIVKKNEFCFLNSKLFSLKEKSIFIVSFYFPKFFCWIYRKIKS